MSDASYIVEAGAILQDSALSPEQIAERLASLCRSAVHNASSAHKAFDGDTPGLEGFLWGLWGALLALAQGDSSTHDRLAAILAAMKTQGKEDWELWNEPFDWENLPVFGISARELMNGPAPFGEDGASVESDDPEYLAALSGDPPTDSTASRVGAWARLQWLNLNAFLARLWALGVRDGTFYGITTMRMSLEPHSLPAYRSDPSYNQPSPELELEVAALWVRIAGKRMFECREILGPKGNPDWSSNRGCPGGSGGTWDGVDGYHPDRWQHWKGIFRQISQGEWRQNVIDAAKAAVEAMEEVEREARAADDTL